MPRKLAVTPALAKEGARSKAPQAKLAASTRAKKPAARLARPAAPEPAVVTAAPGQAQAHTARPKGASKTASKASSKTASKASSKTASKAASRTATKTTSKTALKAAGRAAAAALHSPAPKREGKTAAVSGPTRGTARPALVRDSFTMPEQEYAVIAEVRQACLRAGIEVKKSELLRIGVALLGQLDIATLKAVLAALPRLATGRPPSA
jgi:hypothetical protein